MAMKSLLLFRLALLMLFAAFSQQPVTWRNHPIPTSEVACWPGNGPPEQGAGRRLEHHRNHGA